MATLPGFQSNSEQEEKKPVRFRLNPDGTLRKLGRPVLPKAPVRFKIGQGGQLEAVDKPGFFSRVFKTIGRTQAGPMGRLSPDEMSEAARGVSTELVSAAKGPAEELTTYDLAAAREQARALAISKGEKFKDPTIPLFTVGKRGEPRRDATARDLAGVGLLPGFYPPSGGVYEERRGGPSVREELQVPITKALFGVSATEAVHIAAERDKALRRLPPDEQLRRSPGKLAALAKFGIVPRQETELEQGRARPVEDAFALAAGFVDFFTSAEGAIVLGAGILGGPFAAVGITGFYAVESGVHAADAFDRLARSQGVDLSTVEDIDTLLKIFDNPDPDLLQEFFTSAGLTFFLTGSAPKAPRAAQLAKKKIRAAWEAYNEKYPAATIRQMIEQLMAQKKGRPSPDVYIAEGPMPKGPLFPPPAPAVVPTLETDIHKPIAEMTIEEVRRRQAQPRATDDASIAAELQHRATQLEGPTPREAARKRADEARKAPISEAQAVIAAEGAKRVPVKAHEALIEGAVRAHEVVSTLEGKPETPRFQAKLDFAERKLRDALAKLRASTTLADRVRLQERVSKAKAVATEIREAIKDVDRQEAARAAIRGKEGQKIPFEDRVKVHEQLGDKFDIVSGYRSLRKMPEEGTTGRLAVEEARAEIRQQLRDIGFPEDIPNVLLPGETFPGEGIMRQRVPQESHKQVTTLLKALQRPVIKTRRIQVTRKGGGPLTLARQREIFGKKLRTKLTVRELEERATQLEIRGQELEGVLTELEGGRVERGPSIDKQIAQSEAELESFIGKEAMEEYRQTSRDAGLRDSEYLEAIGDLARTEKNIRAERGIQARKDRPGFAKDPERGGFTIGGKKPAPEEVLEGREKPRLRKQRQGRELLEDPEAFFQRARERAVHTEVLDLEIPSGENGWIIPGRIGFIKGRFAMHDELMGRILSDDIALRGDMPPFQGEAKKVAIELKDTALEKGFVRKADTGVYEVHKFTEQTFRDLNDDLILTKWARPDQVIYIDYRTKSGRKTTFMSSAEEFAVEGFNLEKLVRKHQARWGERGFLKLDGLHKLREYFERFKVARDKRQLEDNLPEVIQKSMKPEEVTRLAAHFRDNLDLATELPAIAEFLADPNKRRVYLAIADAMTDPNFMKFKNTAEFVGRLESLGTNLQEFRQWWEYSMSEWGRLGNAARQFTDMLMDRGVDLKQVRELGWFDRAMENIRKADDVRRAALISQPATAVRNALVQIPVGTTRVITETIAAILDRGARRIMFGDLFDVLDSNGKLVQGMLTKEQATKISAKQKGWSMTPMEESLHQTFAHSLEIINSAFRQIGATAKHLMLNQNAAKQLGFFSPQSRAVLQKFPYHVERMFAFVDPDVNLKGFGRTAGKVVRALTFFNRWQEFYFRRTFADAMLRAELLRKGVDMSQLDKIPKARLEPMVVDAVDTALRLTFAEGPQSQFGKSFLRMWDQARPITTAFHPFVRFAMNSSKYVARHSPARALSPYHLHKLWELMSSGKPEDVLTASRMVSETLVGTMFVAGGYLLAKSQYGGPKWYNIYDPETKDTLFDARPFMPFGLYMYLGHMLNRAKETTQALEAAEIQVGGEPMTPAEFNTRWLISIGGAITSGDSLEALTSMNRLAGSGLIFAELLLQGDRILPRDPVERERELGNLVKEFFGSFLGGYTTPLRPLKDFFALWNPIDREFQSARTDPFWGNLVRNLPYSMQEFLGHPLPIAPSPTTGLSEPLKPQFGLPGTTVRQVMPLFQQRQRDILRYEIDRLVRDRFAEYRSFFPTKTGFRVIDAMKIRYFGEFMKAQATQMVDDPAFALLDGEMRADRIKSVARMAKSYATFRTFYEINQARQQKGLSLIPFQYIQGRAEAREARELGIGAPELTTEDIPE